MSLNLSPLDEQLTKLDQEGRNRRRPFLITAALLVVAIVAGWAIWIYVSDPEVHITGCNTISLNGEPFEVPSGGGYGSIGHWKRGSSYLYTVEFTSDSKGCVKTVEGRRKRVDPDTGE
jgi:hypothetical protein